LTPYLSYIRDKQKHVQRLVLPGSLKSEEVSKTPETREQLLSAISQSKTDLANDITSADAFPIDTTIGVL